MEFIITFFRDILNGPLYIVVSVISGILICSCIGYLAEQSQLKRKAKEKTSLEYADLSQTSNVSTQSNGITNNVSQQPNNISK